MKTITGAGENESTFILLFNLELYWDVFTPKDDHIFCAACSLREKKPQRL